MSKLKTGEYENVKWVRAVAGWGKLSIKVFLYLVDEVLVDTGPARLARVLDPFLKRQHIKKVVLTHYHEDHCGNAPYLSGKGLPVYVNPLSVKRCKTKTRLPFYRNVFWGNRGPFFPHSLRGELKAGGLTWKPVATPGHVFDHRAFYIPEKGFLFTGDLLVTPRPRIILNTESTPQIIEDLKKVMEYDISTVFCGHAGIVKNGRKLLQKKLDYLQDLQEKIINLHQKGCSMGEINRKVFPGTDPLEYISCREWSSEHIVRSLITGKARVKNPKPQT